MSELPALVIPFKVFGPSRTGASLMIALSHWNF
jgi:hypothetical protein